MSSDLRRGTSLLVALLLAASACGPAPSPSSSPSGATSPGTGGNPPGTLRIAYPFDEGFGPRALGPLSNISGEVGRGTFEVARRVFEGLYRYDQRFTPIPNLATCDIDAAGVAFTCHLIDAKFHDGATVTANDVRYIYDLARTESCPFGTSATAFCLADILDGTRVVDARTVEFRLKKPYAPFQTVWLPNVWIQPRQQIEAEFAELQRASSGIRDAELDDALSTTGPVADEGTPAECAAAIERTSALVRRLGLEPDDKNGYGFGRDGAFDGCAYLGHLWNILDRVRASRDAEGLEAIARAYAVLPLGRHPIGTGPWRATAFEPGNHLVLDAFPEHHNGAPAAPRLDYVFVQDVRAAAAAIAAGSVDIAPLQTAKERDIPRALERVEGLKFASFPNLEFVALYYNLRPGALFADANIREAIELCIDKKRTVEGAIGDDGIAIQSDTPPGSWAYVEIPPPARDVTAARALIESSGWMAGEDGIFTKAGRRLSAEVPVRVGFADRIRFIDLIAFQVAECGIELRTRPLDFGLLLDLVFRYPHLLPGTEEQFDAYLGGTGIPPDPDSLDFWHSSRITTADGICCNFTGYSDSRMDRLIDQGLATYDLATRASIYRQQQQLLAKQHAALFGYSVRGRVAMDERLTSNGGSLDLTSPAWDWQFERVSLSQAGVP